MLMPLILLASVSQAQNKSKLDYAYNFLPLQNKIQSWVDSGYYNGASIIIAKDNKVVYKKYFGTYNPETVVFIASAGKWLAAATIAAVVDENKLNWTDKVKKWLPEFTGVKGEATLTQLLSHTSGYPDYQPKEQPLDIYQTLKESVAQIVNLPADTLPGTKFKYGGLAMQIAGRIAELATGKDWETLFQEKIAIPLQIRSTHFTPVDSSGGHAPMLGGGAKTTLQDYANFLSMISNDGMFNGKRILSVNAIKLMQANHVIDAKVNAGEFVENVRGSLRKDIYGLGEWIEEVNAKGEATLISSPSWAGAYPWIDKKNNVYGFFLTHVSKSRNGFNSFLSSPVIPLYVRDAILDATHPEVKRGFVNVDNGKLFYEELGKGEPLIFIHGHSFDHYEWEPQFYAFAKKYRVIRYDVRGYGRSTMPQEFATYMHADDLAILMDSLNIKKAHVVGLSMGGFIGLDFLVLHQNRLLSVTLANGDVWNGSPGPSSPWTAGEITKRRDYIQSLYQKGIHNIKKDWFNALTIRNGKPIEQLRQPIWNMIYKWDAWQPTHIEPRFLLGTSVIEKLKQTEITVPVLVLTGDEDSLRKKKVIELVPAAKQMIIPKAGHVSNLENAERFNTALFTFLNGVK
ncbi:MAG: class A beta-lactamase-related serine hydrolase [Rhizobacter sp.]|nr:class A beta-lactamase-related serine hydrolase [Ferruginibacter sp.]